MGIHNGNWQKIWKLLTHPATELVATLIVVMVATWYLVETGPRDPIPLFGRR